MRLSGKKPSEEKVLALASAIGYSSDVALIWDAHTGLQPVACLSVAAGPAALKGFSQYMPVQYATHKSNS